MDVFSSLTLYGSVYALLYRFDIRQLAMDLKQFEPEWKPYNPRKKDYKRWGLSLTSLDGGLSGTPDLDSVREYNIENQTALRETSFRTWTPVATANEELKACLEHFSPHVCRSHLIRFGSGGFFPPHRDGTSLRPETFRLFSVLSHSTSTDYHFIIDGKAYVFVPGVLYFINTLLEHSFFSFSAGVTILVLNIECNEDAYQKVNKVLASF